MKTKKAPIVFKKVEKGHYKASRDGKKYEIEKRIDGPGWYLRENGELMGGGLSKGACVRYLDKVLSI